MTPQILEREQTKTAPVPRIYDKRYFPRWEVNKRVEYHEEGGVAFRSYTRDLSLDGTSIFVLGHPPARQRVQIRIHLADQENLEAQGRVAWTNLEPTHQVFGIVFENLSNNAHELIMRHAFEIREDPLLIYGLIKNFNSKKMPLFPEVPSSSSNGAPSAAASTGGLNEGASSKGFSRRWLWKERGNR